jgi:transposase
VLTLLEPAGWMSEGVAHRRPGELREVHVRRTVRAIATPFSGPPLRLPARLAIDLGPLVELPDLEREMVAACLRHLDFLDGEVAALDRVVAQRVPASEEMLRPLQLPG